MKSTYKVSLIFRKSREEAFSIEKIFTHLAGLLASRIGVDKVYVPEAKFSLSGISKNIKAGRALRSDLFHVTGDVHYMVMAFPAHKTILTIHDCVFLHTTKGLKRWLLKRFFLDWPVKHCRLITTISEKSRNEILQYSNCPPEKVVVVPNPIGTQFYYAEKLFNAARPEILFIGSTPNKNLERVIAALENISCHLRIIGSITEEKRQLLSKANISYEQRTGLTEQELAGAYAQCDLVLFPSLYEGFGLPVIESQKSGRPVITSNISPMKEVAGEGACLVDPCDIQSIRAGVEKVIANQAYREGIVQKGFVNVRQYEADAVVDRYLQVYDQVLAGSQP